MADWALSAVARIGEITHLIYVDQHPYWLQRRLTQPIISVPVSTRWWFENANQDPSRVPEKRLREGYSIRGAYNG